MFDCIQTKMAITLQQLLDSSDTIVKLDENSIENLMSDAESYEIWDTITREELKFGFESLVFKKDMENDYFHMDEKTVAIASSYSNHDMETVKEDLLYRYAFGILGCINKGYFDKDDFL